MCVWDRYREELREYNASLLAADPGAKPVPEAEQAAMVGAGMDAFEALERRLEQERKAREREQQHEKQ